MNFIQRVTQVKLYLITILPWITVLDAFVHSMQTEVSYSSLRSDQIIYLESHRMAKRTIYLYNKTNNMTFYLSNHELLDRTWYYMMIEIHNKRYMRGYHSQQNSWRSSLNKTFWRFSLCLRVFFWLSESTTDMNLHIKSSPYNPNIYSDFWTHFHHIIGRKLFPWSMIE